MAVLARSATAAIAERVAAVELPPFQRLRAGERGLVMVRGRIGGDGTPFNLGEATVARAALRLESGAVGFGYALGRDTAKAELIALCDAMIQTERAATIEREVIAPLAAIIAVGRRRTAAQTAATRVDFFTLVRGEG